jgi:outer membrane protein TolC
MKNNISNINAKISSLDVSSSVKIFASYSVSSVDLSDADSTWSIGVSWRYKFDSKEKMMNEMLREIEYENSKESLAREARLNFNAVGVFEQITRKRDALALKNEKLNLTQLLYDSKEKMKSLGVLSDFELLKELEKVRSAEFEVLKNQIELTYQYLSLLSKAGMALDFF